MKRSWLVLVAMLVVVAGCATVDETEWCVKTRYGKVVEEGLATGLTPAVITNVTCFDLTERVYPDDDRDIEIIEAQTADPLTVQGDVSVVVLLNRANMSETYRDKRTPVAVDREIRDAIRSGYRDAIAGWSVADIFSERRPLLSDSIRVYIDRKLTSLGSVLRVHVRDIKAPQQIEGARIEAAAQEQKLIQAMRQAEIDSVQAWGEFQQSRAEAERQRLEGEAYSENPSLLQLRAAQAMADGLARACQGVQTCILGGDVMQRFLAAAGGGN